MRFTFQHFLRSRSSAIALSLMFAAIGIIGCETHLSAPLPLIDSSEELPGFISLARISGNGTVAVGVNSVFETNGSGKKINELSPRPATEYAVRWTADQGYQRLWDVGGTDRGGTRAVAASADGSVIVGTGSFPDGASSFRWSPLTGFSPLPQGEDGMSLIRATNVSADGAVVIGRLWLADERTSAAFLWSPLQGYTVIRPNVESWQDCHAVAVSDNGRTVLVGYRVSQNRDRFIIWNQEDGIIDPLEAVADDSKYVANDLSADGITVVGYLGSNAAAEPVPFRWTASDGFVDLPFHPDLQNRARATAISADGRMIVGYGNDENGWVPIFWDAQDNINVLNAELPDDALQQFDGWRLEQAFDVSRDGRSIFGQGRDSFDMTSSWIVRID